MDQGLNWNLARAFNGLAGHSAALDQLVDVPRPFVAHHVDVLIHSQRDSSFPSDHSTASFAVASTAIVRRMPGRWLLLSGATLVALARVYVGVHYPADVIVGALIGAAFATALLRLDGGLDGPISVAIGIARRLHLG